MKRVIVIAFALLVLPVRAQDTTLAAQDTGSEQPAGVRAETRSKTTKRNPETGRSTIATVDAYTKGRIDDARGEIVHFVADDGDEAWIRPNAVALLEPAADLLAALEAMGRDVSGLRELNDKWFPTLTVDADTDVRREWEAGLLSQGVPLILTMFEFRVSDAGEVFPSFGVRNISDRTIESVSMEVLGFNQFGDVVRDGSTGMATHYASLPGTVRPGDTALFAYRDAPLWTNRSTTCIEIRKIVVTFRDGTSATVDYQLPKARMGEDVYRTMGECSRPGPGP